MYYQARSKYRAKKTTIDGISFASTKEAERYLELKLLESSGKIRDLELQPKFPMIINCAKICTYIADFKYYDVDKKDYVVEDVKGFRTPIYKLKKKLLLALYPGINFIEC